MEVERMSETTDEAREEAARSWVPSCFGADPDKDLGPCRRRRRHAYSDDCTAGDR
jgi:hypothetical protein